MNLLYTADNIPRPGQIFKSFIFANPRKKHLFETFFQIILKFPEKVAVSRREPGFSEIQISCKGQKCMQFLSPGCIHPPSNPSIIRNCFNSPPLFVPGIPYPFQTISELVINLSDVFLIGGEVSRIKHPELVHRSLTD